MVSDSCSVTEASRCIPVCASCVLLCFGSPSVLLCFGSDHDMVLLDKVIRIF